MRGLTLKRDARFPAALMVAAVIFSVYLVRSPYSNITGMGRSVLPDPQVYKEGVLFPGFPLDINAATRQELQLVPGIGERLSERILLKRVQKGGFKDMGELLEVEGIGPARLESIKGLITLTGKHNEKPKGRFNLP